MLVPEYSQILGVDVRRWMAWLFLTGSLVLVAATALAVLPPGGTFIDDDGNIHEGNIEAIAAAGITKGCNPKDGNTKYCPSNTVSRGQMSAFIGRALGLPATDVDFFIDDDESIFENDINRMAAAGITKGCNPKEGNTKFCPDNTVTREQMAAFLSRAFGYTDNGGGDLFSDDDDSIFENDIDKLATAGVTKGCNPSEGNTKFCPKNPVRRDQMASFLARALGLKPIQPPPSTTSTTLPTTTTSSTTTTLPGFSFGAGVWFVGAEIPPDTYRNSNFSGGCYWKRLSGFSGTFDDIIANNFDYVRQIVEIKPSDAGFSTDSDCGTWSTDLSPLKSPKVAFGGGTWQVGSEVAPGTWRNSPADTGCYWERLSGFSWESEDTIANDFISDLSSTIVTIQSGDVGFYADEDCGTWTYIGS